MNYLYVSVGFCHVVAEGYEIFLEDLHEMGSVLEKTHDGLRTLQL